MTNYLRSIAGRPLTLTVLRGASSPGAGVSPLALHLESSPAPLGEADLASLWQGQRFPPEALVTVGGQRLRVIYRGRCVGGPGPDFRDAILAGPGGLLEGDVELHVRSSDFRRHGHHLDPAYDGLALHVVFRHDEPSETVLRSGRRVPVVALADWLEGRAREIQRWLERPALWEEPCLSAPARLGGEAVAAALGRLGDIRFRQRTAAFRRRLRAGQSPDEALWLGLLEALSYGGEASLAAVGEKLPWATLRASLLEAPGEGGREERASALLLEAGQGLAARGRPARPGNRPQERLRGAAVLAARFCRRGPAAGLAALVEGRPEKATAALLRALTASPYIGRSRAVEIAANAALPALAASGGRDLEAAAEAVYRRLPLPARYGAVKHLHRAVGGALRVNARAQQGMLYLLRQYCTQGGCGRCPLS